VVDDDDDDVSEVHTASIFTVHALTLNMKVAGTSQISLHHQQSRDVTTQEQN
jgi:hypothetical protein